MEKSEIEVARSWIDSMPKKESNKLKKRDYWEWLGNDRQYLELFRKEVLKPFADNLPNYQKRLLMSGNAESDYEYAFELYSKEVLQNKPKPVNDDNVGDGEQKYFSGYDEPSFLLYKSIDDNVIKSGWKTFYYAVLRHQREVVKSNYRLYGFDEHNQALTDLKYQLQNKSSEPVLLGKLKEAEINLSNYNNIEDGDLRQVSELYDRVNGLIMRTDSIHEDVIEFMIKPFSYILKHHGINLDEHNF